MLCLFRTSFFMSVFLSLLLATSVAQAGTVTGDPSGAGGVQASIPVSASVGDYAEISFNSYTIPQLSGAANQLKSAATDLISIASNVNLQITFTPTRFQHNTDPTKFLLGKHIVTINLTPYQLSPDGPIYGANGTSISITQNAAPLRSPVTYPYQPSAITSADETIAGNYSGSLVVTVVKI